jgi:hypothetical protein
MTLFPGATGGDGGELITVAKEFGIAHPTGYPLFTFLASFMIHTFSFGSTVWKVNVLSASIGSVSNVMLYLNVKRFSGIDSAGVLTAGWCGFSRLIWMWNIKGDVFSLVSFEIILSSSINYRIPNIDW